MTARISYGHMGLFGDYLEREGHSAYVEWQQSSSGVIKQEVVPWRAKRGEAQPNPDSRRGRVRKGQRARPPMPPLQNDVRVSELGVAYQAATR